MQGQCHVIAGVWIRIDCRVCISVLVQLAAAQFSDHAYSSADGRLRIYDIRMGQLQEDYIGGEFLPDSQQY